MNDTFVVGLVSVAALGGAAQWLGWRLRLPAILLLLLFGMAAGPDGIGLVPTDEMFGDLLLPLVAIAVAILLFEGALTLHLPELGDQLRVVGRLVTVGAAITWALSAVGAHFVLGLSWPLAILLGSILTVTGPTVVLPLLRQIRPTGAGGAVLKWEGILIDPIGAVLAVLVFEVLLNGTSMFNHSNIRIPLRVDRILRWIVVTPDMHRVHHSIDEHEANSNFGFNLPWWDRLLGTYTPQPRDTHEGMIVGVDQFRTRRDLWIDRMLVQPLRGETGAYPIRGELDEERVE